MATPPAESHQLEQEALAALIVPRLLRVWPLLDVSRLTETLPLFRDSVQAIVDYFGQAATSSALDFYRTRRLSAGVAGRVTLPPVTAVPEGFVDELVVDSVSPLLLPGPDVTEAHDTLDAGAEHLVMEAGRRQLLSAASVDREAKGWARVPNADACSFCLMLALRPHYKTKASASFRAHTRQPNGSGGECKCSAEPVFGAYEPPARVREAQRLWTESTKGRSGHDARTAFRQAVEGRPVTGVKAKGAKPAKPSKPSAGKPGDKNWGKTPENQRAQLRVLEAMPPATTPEAAAWRAGRIAEIHKFLGE